MIEYRKPWTRQPQGLVRPADDYADMQVGWMPTTGHHNIGALPNWTRQGTPTKVITKAGRAEFSSSYTSNNRYTGASVNPNTANWPGVTVVAKLFTQTHTSNTYPSVLGWVPVGEFYGGYLLSVERDFSGNNLLYWRVGDSANQLTSTTYGSTPSVNGWEVGEELTIVAGWDKSTTWMMVNRNGSIVYNENAHVFGWRNSTALHSVLGYFRSTNRTLPHALSLAAAIPRDLRRDALKLAENPWRLFAPRRIWVPVAAAGGSTVTSTSSLSVAVQSARSAAASAGLAIQAPHSATVSASAAVQQIQTAQASLQAAVQQAQQATTSVSVAAQAAGTESANLQAAIQQARTATSSLNAYLQAGSSMVADIDLAVQQGRAAAASASIAARVQQALAADLSLAARQARSAAASLSMSIQGATATTVTAGLNVAVQELLTAAVGVNMALQSMRTASAALSAYLIMRRTVSAAMSTAAQATRTGTAGLSLYVQGAEVVQPLSAPPAKQRLQSSSRGANLQTSRRPLYRGGSR